jgi:hypothetical protein
MSVVLMVQIVLEEGLRALGIQLPEAM